MLTDDYHAPTCDGRIMSSRSFENRCDPNRADRDAVNATEERFDVITFNADTRIVTAFAAIGVTAEIATDKYLELRSKVRNPPGWWPEVVATGSVKRGSKFEP